MMKIKSILTAVSIIGILLFISVNQNLIGMKFSINELSKEKKDSTYPKEQNFLTGIDSKTNFQSHHTLLQNQSLPNSSEYYSITQAYWGLKNFEEYSISFNNNFTVVLDYTGRSILNVNASLDMSNFGSDLINNDSIIESKSQLYPNTRSTIRFRDIQINQSLQIGTFNLTFRLDFIFNASSYFWEEEIAIPLTDSELPDLEIVDNFTELVIGTQEVTYIVNNLGFVPAVRLEYQVFSLTGAFNVLGASLYTRNWLLPQQAWNIEINISVVQPVESVSISMILTFRDQFNRETNITIQFGYELELNLVKEVILANSGNLPINLYPGDTGVTISAVMANTGNDTIENIKISLLLDKFDEIIPSFPGSDNVSIAILNPGGTTTQSFFIDLSDEIEGAEVYTLDLELIADNYSEIFEIPIIINEKARFSLTELIINPNPIYQGDRGINMLLEIRNRGALAENVRIRLVNSFFSGTVVSYVQAVNPNSIGYGVFDLDLNSQAPIGQISVEFQLSWIQEDRDFVESIWATITIYQREDLSVVIVLGVFLAIILMLVGNWYLKRRKIRLEEEV